MSATQRLETPAIQCLRYVHVGLFSIVEAAADGRLDVAHDEAARLLGRLRTFLGQADLLSPDVDDA